MAKKVVHTQIDGQEIKLSNLQKNLYPDAGITKAEIIQYYLAISDHLLAFASSRPLTLIRYPDGIDKTKFYSKNTPDYTPDWIVKRTLPWDEENVYSFLEGKADVVYFANLAALELHITSSKYPDIECPDHFVIDLDPDPRVTFEEMKDMAVKIKDYLYARRFTPFVKTSGGKGLHIVVPLIPDTDFDVVMTHFKSLFKAFIKENPVATLSMSKEKRKGKVLLDIYRNHRGNTTVAPFSLRAKPGGPISMPIPWDALDDLESAQYFTLRNYTDYPEYLTLWSNIFEKGVSIQPDDLEVPDSLNDYQEKRNFIITTEPQANASKSVNDKFVLQLHDASNLHYDLRLGIDGVMKSWAIPKSLPHTEGVKRMAIQTEDHPASYLTYEGTIPKGEYGAGKMWIMDTGTIEWQTQKDGKYAFTLVGNQMKQSYNLVRTKDSQWLISSTGVNEKQSEIPKEAMLASATEKLPKKSSKVFYEVKWDGIRVCVVKYGITIKLYSRSGRDITEMFPEFLDPDLLAVEHCILDGEIVVLDPAGRPLFSEVIGRMHGKANRGKMNAVLYAFDCLAVDNLDISKLAIERRRDILTAVLDDTQYYRYSQIFSDGAQLMEAIMAQGMEGIMIKTLGSKYHAGQRTTDWKKLKVRNDQTAYIIGYTEGSGDRSPYFGSLVLAEYIDEAWVYKGRVGTGFDTAKLKSVLSELKKIEVTKKMVKEKIDEENKITWIQPVLQCEIKYASMSSNNTFREPVFKKLILP